MILETIKDQEYHKKILLANDSYTGNDDTVVCYHEQSRVDQYKSKRDFTILIQSFRCIHAGAADERNPQRLYRSSRT